MAERDKPDALPGWVTPQLATLTTVPPDSDGWVHEVKLNGHRMLMRVESGRVRLLARNRQDWTPRLPAIAAVGARLPARRALLDGELVAFDEAGISRFQRLQEALAEEDGEALEFVAFDLLHLDGRDLRALPLLERKALLAERLAERGGPGYSKHVEGPGRPFYDHACEKGFEGVVSKLREAPYVSGRSSAWLKVKCASRQQFAIGGFTDPEGEGAGPREGGGVGALLLGVQDRAGRLVYAGSVSAGLGRAVGAELRERLGALEHAEPSFARPPAGAPRGVHWVRPTLVGDIAFARWPRGGAVGDAVFLGLSDGGLPAGAVSGEVLPGGGSPNENRSSSGARTREGRSATAVRSRR